MRDLPEESEKEMPAIMSEACFILLGQIEAERVIS